MTVLNTSWYLALAMTLLRRQRHDLQLEHPTSAGWMIGSSILRSKESGLFYGDNKVSQPYGANYVCQILFVAWETSLVLQRKARSR